VPGLSPLAIRTRLVYLLVALLVAWLGSGMGAVVLAAPAVHLPPEVLRLRPRVAQARLYPSLKNPSTEIA
jgi:hypothetical protein